MPFAHRGLHDRDVPENTHAAFEQAIEAGYGIELDVRLSKDGEAVVFHDQRLERLTDVRGPIADQPMAVLSRTQIAGSGETIPSLAAVLALIAGRAPLLVEIKNEQQRTGALERRVYEVVQSYDGPYAVQSFNPLSTRWFARSAPAMQRGHLVTARTDRGRRRQAAPSPSARVAARMARATYVGYDVRPLPCRQAAGLRAAGFPVLAWTIRTAAERRAVAAFADNIIFEAFMPELGTPTGDHG